MPTYDDFLPFLGEFGPYQRRILLFACIIVIPSGAQIFAQVFLGARTDHWCALPPSLETQNCSQFGIYTSQKCEAVKKALFIPSGSQCSRYDLDYNVVEFHPDLNATQYINGTTECIDGWTYDRSQYTSTIVQEFNLVCDKKTLPDVAQSVFAVGFITGAFLSGWLSDRLGRKPALFIFIAINAVFGTALAFSPNLIVYTVIRFVIASTSLGVYYIAFICVAEYVGPTKRTLVGALMAIASAFGYMILAVLAFFIRDWRTLQLAISLPSFLLFVFIPFWSESARWLLNRGEIHKAKPIIDKAAKYAKVEIPSKIYECDEKFYQKRDPCMKVKRRPSYIDIFTYPNIRYRTFNLMFNGFVNNLVYYGLSWGTASLGGNQFLAAFLSAAVEIPAYATSQIAIEKWGRRGPLCIYMIIAGIAVICTIWLPLGHWRIAVAMVGKFSVSGSYNVAFIFIAELFPTPIRSIGLGACSMAAHLAGIAAPMILSLGLAVWEPLPFLIFGVAAIVAGALALLFPETKGAPLQETMQESEDFGKKKKMDKGLHITFHPEDGKIYNRVYLDENDESKIANSAPDGDPINV